MRGHFPVDSIFRLTVATAFLALLILLLGTMTPNEFRGAAEARGVAPSAQAADSVSKAPDIRTVPGESGTPHFDSKSLNLESAGAPSFPPRKAHSLPVSAPIAMGISDVGATSSGTEFYTSSSFEGTASISSLSVCASPSPCGSTWMTFQLNLNLGFENGGNWYDYWVQDVALVNTGAHTLVAIENNIWNLSGYGSTMYASTVSGNGAIYPSSAGDYYAFGISTPIGYNAFQLIANASVNSNGQPTVRFMYDFGNGFTTYDFVKFAFVSQLAYSDDFIVDGQTSNPVGLAYDAEWVMGGPGGGSSTIDESSNLQLGLLFWNGNNYETVNNAVDYGEDTGESISNAAVAGEYYLSSGAIFAQVGSGAETLGTIWYSTNIAIVDIQGPGSCNGILYSGSERVPYLGGYGSIAVGPASLDFQVGCDRFTEDFGSYSLGAGTTTTLSAGTWVGLNFGQTGLPNNSPWGVSIGSDVQSNSGVLVSFYLPPGTYTFLLTGGSGYMPTPSEGTIAVGSAGGAVSVVWNQVRLISGSSTGSVDAGQVIQFSASLNGSSGDSYSWNGLPTGCTGANSATLSCRPSSAGSYGVSVSVTDAMGFVATSRVLTFPVFKDPSVTPPAGLRASSDVGQGLTISTVVTPGSGGDAYFWTGLPAGCTSTDSYSITCSPTAAGIFSINVTITDSNGYTASATSEFAVYALPTVGAIQFNPGSTVLQGLSVTLLVNETPGFGDLTFSWSGLPTGCQSVNASSVTCSPSASGIWTVSVTVTDSNRGSATSVGVSLAVQSNFFGIEISQTLGWEIVAVLMILVVALVGIVLSVSRRRRKGENDESIAKRVSEYRPGRRMSPVSDITVPMSEVWSNRTDRSTAPAAEARASADDEMEPGTRAPGYWDTPLINPPEPVCWNCTFENPPASRYCAKCGLPLEGPPSQHGA